MKTALSFLLLLLTACGVDPQPLVPVAATHRALTPRGTTAPIPDQLTCVTSPLEGTSPPEVVRGWLSRGGDGGWTASLSRGPQFFSHGGVSDQTERPAPPEIALAVVEETAGGLLVSGDGGVSALLRRDGPVVRGSLTQGFVSADLTCWSANELFGGEYGGGASVLPAHFDWTLGACADADGAPARNLVPIEVVRETGFGECADLAGVELNGGDFGMPDLAGWMLEGANLDGAQLFFGNLTFAMLQGAHVDGLQFGYATVSGSIDAHTTLPNLDESGCTVAQSEWSGDTLTCSR